MHVAKIRKTILPKLISILGYMIKLTQMLRDLLFLDQMSLQREAHILLHLQNHNQDKRLAQMVVLFPQKLQELSLLNSIMLLLKVQVFQILHISIQHTQRNLMAMVHTLHNGSKILLKVPNSITELVVASIMETVLFKAKDQMSHILLMDNQTLSMFSRKVQEKVFQILHILLQHTQRNSMAMVHTLHNGSKISLKALNSITVSVVASIMETALFKAKDQVSLI